MCHINNFQLAVNDIQVAHYEVLTNIIQKKLINHLTYDLCHKPPDKC